MKWKWISKYDFHSQVEFFWIIMSCKGRVPIKDLQMMKSKTAFQICTPAAEGLVQWLRSLPPNPEVPGSIPGLVKGWIFGWPSFPLKFTQLSILPGSVKWVPAYMDRFEAAARGAYICFRSAGGKLIIVKRLWACYMEKALYKCTTL